VTLGHPSKFQRASRLGFITAATSLNGGQPNFARCLAVSCTGTLYIQFRGLLPPNGISLRAILTLRPNLAFSYIGSVTAPHSSSGRQLNCGVQQRAPPTFGRAAIALGIGPHSSFVYRIQSSEYITTYMYEYYATCFNGVHTSAFGQICNCCRFVHATSLVALQT